MPRYTRRNRRGRVRARPMPNRRRNRNIRRRITSNLAVFSETFKGPTINFNQNGSGLSCGLLQNTFATVPQVADYTDLYNSYTLKRVTAILMPAYNTYDQPPVTGAVTTAPRLVTAIDDSALSVPPTSELQVLEDNTCKIRMFTKPVKISWTPKPATADALTAGGFAASNRKANTWFNTGTTGINVIHNGLQYAFSYDLPPAGNYPLCQVYYKLTFALRDAK